MNMGMDGAGPQAPPMPPGEDEQDRLVTEKPPLTLRCKILLLGDSTVGKTSLAAVFAGGAQAFPKTYAMSFGGELTIKKVPIPDTNAVVEMYIVDCGGFPDPQNLLKPHWESANAVMLVY